MKIFVIEGRSYCNKSYGGIQLYKTQVLNCLDRIMDGIEYEIHVCYPSDVTIQIGPYENIKLVALKRSGKERFLTHLLPKYMKEKNAIYLDLGIAWCQKYGGIVTLHDARPISQTYDRIGVRILQRLKYQYDAIVAKYIVTVSDAQKKELARALWINEDKIKVIGNGWNHFEQIEMDNTIFDRQPNIEKGNYFYSVGSQYPHKNFIWVIEVAKRNAQAQFVVAGRSINGVHIEEMSNVIYVGPVTDEENKALISNCRAYVHPAKYEGFGIPPLEALSCGVPVFASDIPVLHEIYANTIHYFNPDDYEIDLEKEYSYFTEDSSEVLKRYTWENTALAWHKLLKEY